MEPGRIRRVVVVPVLLALGVGIGMTIADAPDGVMGTATGFVFYLALAWSIAVEARRVGSPLPPVHDLRLDARRGSQLAVLIVSTFVVSLAGLYLSLIALSWPLEEWVTNTFLRPDDDAGMPEALLHRALLTIEAVALAPIVEELLFRGVMLHWWAARWGVKRAVVASALVFGALHFDPLGTTLFAFVATALYMSFRTMLAPIVFHAMWNCTVTVLSWLPAGRERPDETIQAFRADWPWAALYLAAAAILLGIALRRLHPPDGWRLPPLRFEGGPAADVASP